MKKKETVHEQDAYFIAGSFFYYAYIITLKFLSQDVH